MKLASDQIEGMGFAIPIEIALEYAEQFVSGKDVRRPYIGVSIYDSRTSFFSSESYVVIESVEEGSPADKAGLKKGDIVVKLGNEDISGLAEFRYELYRHDIGEKLEVTYYRNGSKKTTTITLGKNKS